MLLSTFYHSPFGFASNILPWFFHKTEGKVSILFYFLIKKEITFSLGFIKEPRGIITQLAYNELMPYTHTVTLLKILSTHQSTRYPLHPIRTRTPPLYIIGVGLWNLNIDNESIGHEKQFKACNKYLGWIASA